MANMRLIAPTSVFSTKKSEFQRSGEDPSVDEMGLVANKLQKQELLHLRQTFRKLGQHSVTTDYFTCQRQVAGTKNESNERPDAKFFIIYQMLRERESLLNTLDHMSVGHSCSSSSSDKTRHVQTSKNMACHLLDQYNNYVDVINFFLNELKDSSYAVDRITKAIRKVNLTIRRMTCDPSPTSSTSSSCQSYEQIKKHIASLETRLHILTTRYDTFCWRSSQVRQEITYLLLSRQAFHLRLEAYRKKLGGIKEDITRIVSKCHLCYEYIEQAKSRAKVMSQRNHKESIIHALEIKEQARLATNYRKLYEFHRIKNKPRPRYENEDNRKIAALQKKLERFNRTLVHYEQAFSEIHAKLLSARISDPFGNFNGAAIATEYKKKEECNFVLFRYNVDMNHEISAIDDEIDKLRKKIKRARKDRRDRNIKLKKTLRFLRKRLERTEARHRLRNETWTKSQQDMNIIVNTFQTIAKTTGIGHYAGILRLLGRNHKTKLQPSMLMVVLKALEHRILYLKALKYYIKNMERKKTGKRQQYDFRPSFQSQSDIMFSQFLNRIQNQRSSSISEEYQGGLVAPEIIVTPIFELPEDGDEEERLFRTKCFTHSEMMNYCLDKYYRKMAVHPNATSTANMDGEHKHYNHFRSSQSTKSLLHRIL